MHVQPIETLDGIGLQCLLENLRVDPQQTSIHYNWYLSSKHVFLMYQRLERVLNRLSGAEQLFVFKDLEIYPKVLPEYLEELLKVVLNVHTRLVETPF